MVPEYDLRHIRITTTNPFVLPPLQGQTVFTCVDDSLTTDERYDGRTTIVERPRGVGGAVTAAAVNVSSLRESDTGRYECQVTYAGGGARPTVQPPLLPLPGIQRSSTARALTAGDADADGGVRFRLEVEGEHILYT